MPGTAGWQGRGTMVAVVPLSAADEESSNILWLKSLSVEYVAGLLEIIVRCLCSWSQHRWGVEIYGLILRFTMGAIRRAFAVKTPEINAVLLVKPNNLIKYD